MIYTASLDMGASLGDFSNAAGTSGAAGVKSTSLMVEVQARCSSPVRHHDLALSRPCRAAPGYDRVAYMRNRAVWTALTHNARGRIEHS